jgi:hypothetical protein
MKPNQSLGSFVTFAFAGKVLFGIGIPIALSNLAGGYLGSILAIKKGQQFIKVFLLELVLIYPDGRTKTVEGVSDAFGSFAGSEAYPLDVPGIYRYQVKGTWQGNVGKMPGLPDSGGLFFVLPKDRPKGAEGLTLDMPSQVTFPVTGKWTISGRSTASKVTYALIMPGAVLAQGELPVVGDKFQLVIDPTVLNDLAPIYDITSVTTGAPQIGRVLHLTFAANEKAPDGTSFWDFKRLVIRGTTAVWAK